VCYNHFNKNSRFCMPKYGKDLFRQKSFFRIICQKWKRFVLAKKFLPNFGVFRRYVPSGRPLLRDSG
jgi:hypothetical protein